MMTYTYTRVTNTARKKKTFIVALAPYDATMSDVPTVPSENTLCPTLDPNLQYIADIMFAELIMVYAVECIVFEGTFFFHNSHYRHDALPFGL